MKRLGSILTRLARDYAEDLLILSGLGVIVYASFRLHEIAGLYVLGLVLAGVGWLLAGGPTLGRKGR